jgi:hypothetical protein
MPETAGERQRQVFAVSSGAYSDYSVWCIFESRENAENYAAAHAKMSVEEYRRRSQLPGDHRESLGYHVPQVEEFDFYATGEIPVE